MEQETVILPQPTEEAPASIVNANVTANAITTEPLRTYCIRQPSPLYFVSKRLIDITFSLLGLVVLMPIFLVIALCIKLDDGAEILHFRQIIGQNGQRFFALKFRTMIRDADDYLAKHPELMRKYQQNMKLIYDPRVTRVGKFLRK